MPLSPEPRAPHARSSSPVRWTDMRCDRCGRLLQRIEEHALRPGKRLEIKCSHCKVMNYSIGA